MLRIIIAGLMSLMSLMGSSAIAGESADHWAFLPLQDVSLPAIDDPWIKTPVDAFILQQLWRANFSPAPAASRQDFIRRAHVALTGLPPSYTDVAQALNSNEDSDDLFATQLIDRLLASPQFGVRWGRFWLDGARYSDTKGYAYAVEQPDFFHAWRYRDWVVDAFNADLPYDQFVECQIAADRLLEEGECSPDDLAAMGFLTLGRRFLGVEQDIIDDRIDVVTRGLLGLTAACARCHDHKFDPIPTADYYALYGVFKSSRERLAPLKENSANDPELKQLQEELEAVFNKEADAAEKTFLKRADEYLVASLDLSKVPRPAFTEIVRPGSVNPAQIRRWHEYLAQSDKERSPIFAPWKKLAQASPSEFAAVAQSLPQQKGINTVVLKTLIEKPPATMHDVASCYAAIFQSASDESNSDSAWNEVREVMRAPDSPFVIPRKHPHDVEWLFHNTALTAVKTAFAKVERRIVALNDAAAYTVALEDRPVPQNMRILLRGDYCTQGAEVARSGLSVLNFDSKIETGSGRLELARSISHPSNPLTARVMVNRIWHHYFGTGLVKTTSDFGKRADSPSHPDLLDYLAGELIENHWSLKAIHRLIATSATFRQATGMQDSSDPENRLLSHFPRQRIDFETMRDTLLTASGEIDLRLGGSPGELLGDEPSPRRSIYGKIDRKFLPTALRVFDFANPELHSPNRYETNVPQQALFFLNSPFTIQRARALNRNLQGNAPKTRVRKLFQTVYQRNPTATQLAVSLEFINVSNRDALDAPVVDQDPFAERWHYGYGTYDQERSMVTNFAELPHFDGTQWSGGTEWPDPKLGWVRLTADGGHVGNTSEMAAIRRWISPVDGTISIHGAIEKIQECGDGIRVFISGKHVTHGAWQVEFGAPEPIDIDRVAVTAGDAIDFVVDCGEKDDFSCDGFLWTIQIDQLAEEGALAWDSKRDFGGDVSRPIPLTNWERLAQALLLSNEFMFVD